MNKRKVEVVPYLFEWKDLFKNEQAHLRHIFSQGEIKIHHIGSTSVPGLSAKPIIDILIEVESLAVIDSAMPALEKAGYQAKGENGIPGRRYFKKNNENGIRLFHVHAFAKGSPEIYRHLVFRDYLQAHPDEARKYGSIKERAAAGNPNDIGSYIHEKTPVIKELENRATEWRPSTDYQ